MIDADLLIAVIAAVFAILSGIFGEKYRRYKDAFIKTAEAIEDDRVTWDEAKEILESARP